MIKLREILEEVIAELKSKNQYTPKDWCEENVYDSYILLSELLNPNNSYPYKEIKKGLWEYQDSDGNTFFARIVFQPIRDDNEYFEFKTWWVDKDNKRKYGELPDNTSAKDWDRRSDTIAKIFRDEVLVFFKNQNFNDTLKILPVSKSRFVFTTRMVKKFVGNDFEVIEDFPKEVTIKKK